jgi:hypothetical protein
VGDKRKHASCLERDVWQERCDCDAVPGRGFLVDAPPKCRSERQISRDLPPPPDCLSTVLDKLLIGKHVSLPLLAACDRTCAITAHDRLGRRMSLWLWSSGSFAPANSLHQPEYREHDCCCLLARIDPASFPFFSSVTFSPRKQSSLAVIRQLIQSILLQEHSHRSRRHFIG